MSQQSFDHTGSEKRSPPVAGEGHVFPGPGDFRGDVFASPDALAVILDACGIVLAFNRKTVELTGLSRDALLGKDVFTVLFPGHMRDLVQELLLKDLRSYHELRKVCLPLLTGQGHTLSLSWDFCLYPDGSGTMSRILCIGYPVTGTNSPEANASSGPIACASTCRRVHDILNHNQVAMGYLELAMEQLKPESDLLPMLKHVYKSLRQSSDLALDVYQANRNAPGLCVYAVQAGLTARK